MAFDDMGDLRDSLDPFRWGPYVCPPTSHGIDPKLRRSEGRPAVSVTSAVGGIAVAKPNVAQAVVGVSIAFLFGLFAIQRFGAQRLSFVFAPSESDSLLDESSTDQDQSRRSG